MIFSNNISQRIITGLILGASLWTIFFYCPPIMVSIFLLIAMLIMIIELKNMISSSVNFFLLIPFYPITPCLNLIYFNQSEYHHLLVSLFITVFAFDTTCYFVGSLSSKLWTTHKIIPSISPGKSWEGFFGGLIATTALLFFMTRHHSQLSSSHIVLLSLALCSIAFTGDIFESYLKRSAGIKDSGTILPGHGGMLDRFDAMLFVSYFFFIFKNYLITIL